MQKIREEVFIQIFRAGAVRSVTVDLFEDRGAVQGTISYLLLDGERGSIHTKRGDIKHYRVDTAMRFLRGLGLASFSVDASNWHIGQGDLLT